MTDYEKELTQALKELTMVARLMVQKIEREKEARRLARAAEIAYVTEYDADRTTVAHLRATLREAKRRVSHDELLTDAAILEAVAVLDAAPARLEAVA